MTVDKCKTAAITVHAGQQLQVEVFTNQRSNAQARFGSMLEAQEWLAGEEGVCAQNITLRVVEVCDRPADDSGYQGIFRCGLCRDICVETAACAR